MVGGKSTAHITQQQLNKKRQRATPEQLAVLEEAFDVNPSPNAKQREVISAQIDMTERSVQIWFQNRRAKTK
ncbi:homeobox domain-domain-containing protein, partial [Protomyces lactucae-debilis]